MDYVYELLNQYFPNFNIYYGYQKINLDDKKNTIILTLKFSQDTSNNNRTQNIMGVFQETITTGIIDTIQMDFITRDLKNVNNNLKLIRGCFVSVLSQQVQEKNKCKFSNCNNFIDSSILEGVGYVARYSGNIKVIYDNIIQNSIEFYNKFPISIIDLLPK